MDLEFMKSGREITSTMWITHKQYGNVTSYSTLHFQRIEDPSSTLSVHIEIMFFLLFPNWVNTRRWWLIMKIIEGTHICSVSWKLHYVVEERTRDINDSFRDLLCHIRFTVHHQIRTICVNQLNSIHSNALKWRVSEFPASFLFRVNFLTLLGIVRFSMNDVLTITDNYKNTRWINSYRCSICVAQSEQRESYYFGVSHRLLKRTLDKVWELFTKLLHLWISVHKTFGLETRWMKI